MMRKLTLLLALALGGTAHAMTVKQLAMQADIGADGTAQVAAQLQLTDVVAGKLTIPLGFANASALQVQDVPDGIEARVVSGKDAASLELIVQGDAREALALRLNFVVANLLFRPAVAQGQKPTLAADSQLLQYTLVNTQPASIADLQVVFRLPPELQVQQIREQLPKLKKTEVLPRVRLDRFDGLQGARLQFKGLKQGDRTSMGLEVTQERRSLGWLLVGLALALAYLITFRDLVMRASNPNKPTNGEFA